MLNEKKMWEEFNDQKNKRLKNSFNAKDLTGIVYVLSVICRGKLDKERYWEIGKNDRGKVLEEVRKWLEKVCFEADDDNGLSLGVVDKIKTGKNKKEKSRREEWCNHKITSSIFYYNNNATNLSIVMADAVRRGPLKEYYLVCRRVSEKDKDKREFFEKLKYITGKKEYNYGIFNRLDQIGKKSKMEKTYLDRILKEISGILLLKMQNNNTEFVHNERYALSAWMDYSSYATSTKPCEIKYKNTDLIEKNTKLFQNGWVKINKDFCRDYDVRIIEAENVDPNDPKFADCYVFCDDGAGKPLILMENRSVRNI